MTIKRTRRFYHRKLIAYSSDDHYDADIFPSLFSEGRLPDAQMWRALCDEVFKTDVSTHSTPDAGSDRHFQLIEGGLSHSASFGTATVVRQSEGFEESRPLGPQTSSGSAAPRLVILPPAIRSGLAKTNLMITSLIEDITIELCALTGVVVVAPYTAKMIATKPEVRATFLENHSIAYVLDSRIVQTDGDLALFTQLIFREKSEILWAATYSLNQHDLPDRKRLISRRIVQSIAKGIEHSQSISPNLDISADAYNHYLLAKRWLNGSSLPDVRRARKAARAALSTDPHFAPALCLLARTFHKEWLLTAGGDIELLKLAESTASKALALGNNLSGGYRELGIAQMLRGAFDDGLHAFELAEDNGPHYADVIADHAAALVQLSQPTIALEKMEKAFNLNPLSPDSYMLTAAEANFALRRFDSALACIDGMSYPARADRLAAASWAFLDRRDRADIFVNRARRTEPGVDVNYWPSAVEHKERWHRELFVEGFRRAGL
ncbi:hypothetical protein [Rhizobium sp. SL42]|uniref:hypothetical protein n=1 Tax=Rhizobium sp. SL42 TaxID=2806346 RepID=UPI001F1B544C|nr:hypothetical protein [Rhizobium sp. SL42]UJW73559.1 hypothetical protein IM739_11625 [Rhizobium sp. SL42]